MDNKEYTFKLVFNIGPSVGLYSTLDRLIENVHKMLALYPTDILIELAIFNGPAAIDNWDTKEVPTIYMAGSYQIRLLNIVKEWTPKEVPKVNVIGLTDVEYRKSFRTLIMTIGVSRVSEILGIQTVTVDIYLGTDQLPPPRYRADFLMRLVDAL